MFATEGRFSTQARNSRRTANESRSPRLLFLSPTRLDTSCHHEDLRQYPNSELLSPTFPPPMKNGRLPAAVDPALPLLPLD